MFPGKCQRKCQQIIDSGATTRKFESTDPQLAHCNIMGSDKCFVCLKKMKQAYKLFRRRGGVYYAENNSTGEQKILRTRDRHEAKRLLDAYNSTSTALNLELGRVYLRAADPKLASRTWQTAMNELSSHGQEATQERCKREMNSKAFDSIRKKTIIETTAEELKAVLKRGGGATNHYLRRLHNLALGNGWINWPIIPPRQWEKPSRTQRRGITFEQHSEILASEQNPERHHYYQMLWITGAAQTDCSLLCDANIDGANLVLSYQRKKTGEWCHLKIGEELKSLVQALPSAGLLFPTIALTSAKDRAAEFCRRCRVCGVKGVSLHCYRYGWAERAAAAGYPERYAQSAVGHSSKAVHRAYPF
jgi:integrase